MTTQTAWQRLESLPWTPILLLALLISNCMNWVRLREVERSINVQVWNERPNFQNDAIDDLEAINGRLNEVSEATQMLATCSKEVRPVWCKH
jgi:hypothetical protein